jgi:MoaA/NifB/PqqE/SkfB family radical SAM enzyme
MKKYDYWLHWDIGNECNLNCSYCLNKPKQGKLNFWNKKIRKLLQLEISEIIEILKHKFKKSKSKIDLPSLMRTLNKTNKTFKIGFTGGGEPFLIPNVIDVFEQITKKHYISMNTNLTSRKIKEFAQRIRPEKVIDIVASLHIKELERTNLMERYVENFSICEKKGFDIYPMVVAYPPLINEVQKYKSLFNKFGIQIQFSPFNGTYSGKIYPEAYTKEEITAFDLKLLNKSKRKGELCNAGYNAAIVFAN